MRLQRQLKSESRKFDDRLSDLQERQRGVVREEADYKARIQDAQHRLIYNFWILLSVR